MKRNILFITCDQWRRDTLGIYGNPIVKTPHIDDLFQDSVVFHNLYCASPVCAPNRGAIATGKWPTVNGLVYNGYILPTDPLTMVEVFRHSGYRTYGIGKMHLQGMKTLMIRWHEWLRCRFRVYIWKQWKVPQARIRNLMILGIPRYNAYKWGYVQGCWNVAGSPILKRSITNERLARAGNYSLSDRHESLHLCD